MDLEEAIELIKEQGINAPAVAQQLALKALNINDGACTDCGPYALTSHGEYVHPFECQNTGRGDHNLTSFRRLLNTERE